MTVPAALSGARIPERLLSVLRTLDEAGHRSWLVGGAVRDLLLHRPRTAADFDVATPARPEEVQRAFKRVIPTGIEHGTVTVLVEGEPVEVTTFRGEGPYLDGRRPSHVTFHADIDADLARRDFTMNALAFDPLGPDFRDPFGGMADIAAGVIRAVRDPVERFGEDGLRAMRAARFAAQLGFVLDPMTRAAIPGALETFKKVAAERISDELAKLLLGEHAGDGVRILLDAGLLGALAPELAGADAARLFHAARVVAGAPRELASRLAALLHAKPGAARATLERLRFSNDVCDRALAYVAHFRCALDGAPPAWSEENARRFLSQATRARAPAIFALWRAEGSEPLDALAAQAEAALAGNPPLAVGDLALDGKAVTEALGRGPGKHVGEALRFLLDRVLADPKLNDPDALRELLREFTLGDKR